MRVVGAGAGLLVEAGHGFEVMVEDVGQCITEDVDGQRMTSAKIGNQCFDGGGRRLFAYGGNDIGKVAGAPVAQVVTVDAGDDHVTQLEMGDAGGETLRFVGVGR